MINLKHSFLGGVVSEIKCCFLNAENLFYTPDDLSLANKSARKLQIIADTLCHSQSDLIFLSEVGGLESLENFNRDFLDQKFIPSLITGNSDRSIELGMLVTKNFDYKIHHRSYKNMAIDYCHPLNKDQTQYLSRDILEARLFDPQRENQDPVLIILFVHLKSQWDREGHDFRGVERRSSEVRLLAKVSNKLAQKFPNSEQIIAGDFNGEFSQKEFDPLKKTTIPFRDLLEILQVPQQERFSALHFDQNSRPLHSQLDYCLVDQRLEKKLIHQQSGMGRFVAKKSDGSFRPLAPPQVAQARATSPSDHLPLYLKVYLN